MTTATETAKEQLHLTQHDREQLQILEYIATNTREGLTKGDIRTLRAYGKLAKK